MKIERKRWLFGATAALTGAALALGASLPAAANPVGAPTYRALAGVGSDTTQDVMNGISAVVTDSNGTLVVGSYDATGTPTITPKPNRTFARPDGSGDGVTALKAAKNSAAYKGTILQPTDLQFARSSSGATWDSNGAYAYIPLALDAVSFATAPASTKVPNDIPLGASKDELNSDGSLKLTLKNIYTRNATSTLKDSTTGTTYTVGDQASGADIVPFKPQPGSGTLSFWTAQMGGTLGSIVSDTFTYSTTEAECATNPATPTIDHTPALPAWDALTGKCTAGVQEHNGKATAEVSNAVIPFSIAQYLAQSNAGTLAATYGVTVTDRRNSAVLGKVDGVNTTTGTPAVLNTSFPIRRVVFNVVAVADLNDALIQQVFVGSGADAYTALNPQTQNRLVIEDFGFGDITGGVTVPGDPNTYTAGDTNHRAV